MKATEEMMKWLVCVCIKLLPEQARMKMCHTDKADTQRLQVRIQRAAFRRRACT